MELSSYEVSKLFEYCGICVYCVANPAKQYKHVCGTKYCDRCCLKCEGCKNVICKSCYRFEHGCGDKSVKCVRCALCYCKFENDYGRWLEGLDGRFNNF